MVSKFYSFAILSLLIPSFVSCASVPMASPVQDAMAKKYEVEPGKGRIYLYRNETYGGTVKMNIDLDGKVMGQTASDVYFSWDVKPGIHKLNCIAEYATRLDPAQSIDVDVPAGKAVYVWQEMKMGLAMARCRLHQVAEVTGKKAVYDCNRAASSQP